MQIALVSLDQDERNNLQVPAIIRKLAAKGHRPWLLCGPRQNLAVCEAECSMLPLPERPGLVAFFRLWRWQRKIEQMKLIAIGSQSVGLATRLLKMRKKDCTDLNLYLPFPPAAMPGGRDLARFRRCLYGSEFIGKTLEEILDRNKASLPRPDLASALPGLDIHAYIPAKSAWQPGKRFVFGMAASLEPASGALLVIRAMGALWQHDNLPEWEVRMFGAGSRFEEIKTEAATLGVLSRLSILSAQPLSQVTGLCTVWLAPGYSPLIPPEAAWAGFAAGIPVVASVNALHSEQIAEPAAMLPIDGKNPQSMAKAMLALMRDAKLRTELAQAGSAQLPLISLDGMAERVCAALNVA